MRKHHTGKEDDPARPHESTRLQIAPVFEVTQEIANGDDPDNLSLVGNCQMANPMFRHFFACLVGSTCMIDGYQGIAHDGTDPRLVYRTGFRHALANQVRFADDTTIVSGLVYQQCADFRVTHQPGRLQQRGIRTDRAQASAHHHGERSLKRPALNRHTTGSVPWREQNSTHPSCTCQRAVFLGQYPIPTLSLLDPDTVAILGLERSWSQEEKEPCISV